jgi:hypothetical protein
MPIEFIEGSVEDASKIYDCGWRAFVNDGLQNAVFKVADDDLESLQKLKEFRIPRIQKRLQAPGCYAIIAIDKEVDNGSRVLGYAVWYEQPVFEPIDDKQDESKNKLEIPEFINVELLKRVEKTIEETRQEYLKGFSGKIWCKSRQLLLQNDVNSVYRPRNARSGSRFRR